MDHSPFSARNQANYTLEDILSRLPDAKKSGSGYRAPCPAHGGEGPNLKISVGESGAVLFHCFSHDCAYEAIMKALGFDYKPPRKAPAPRTWKDDLQLGQNKQPKENFHNFAMILENDPAFSANFRFDEFLNKPMFDDYPISDAAEANILRWLCEEYGFSGNYPKRLTHAIEQVARLAPYDPLYDWLKSLPEWDGTERLENWLVDWCGAEDTPVTRWIGYATIMQMVARAINPGCEARFVTVLEGEENIGKTRAIKILGRPWTRPFDMSMDTKEAHMIIQGVWLAELSELETIKKSTEGKLKSFISRTEDSYIPKFYNHAVVYLRRTVFIGSTNDNTYLPGIGNTRWLPVKTTIFDLEALEANRDQLIAEARDKFTCTPSIRWWEIPEHIVDGIGQTRDDRRVINPYENELARWLDGGPGAKGTHYEVGKYRTAVTWTHIAEGFLGIEKRENWANSSVMNQIIQALRALGWEPGRDTFDGKRDRCWKRPSVQLREN